jgi:hypothetical protein
VSPKDVVNGAIHGKKSARQVSQFGFRYARGYYKCRHGILLPEFVILDWAWISMAKVVGFSPTTTFVGICVLAGLLVADVAYSMYRILRTMPK